MSLTVILSRVRSSSRIIPRNLKGPPSLSTPAGRYRKLGLSTNIYRIAHHTSGSGHPFQVRHFSIRSSLRPSIFRILSKARSLTFRPSVRTHTLLVKMAQTGSSEEDYQTSIHAY
ncbi:hypothetical protein VC83_01271 [Pseudogymnoascus destructans]|uniref:Uncharacterized protein n=2 Tax=Pseudogymnoascus destructans TaxID=655981 RepID=L8G8S7_PSED2|nr:uncharacterized protein VC83_01271 [Pseudogymnoascus destructans]ELR08441.1 hypothetical protein GMDG_00505 [Pseudogymnoascus destructans 20631-21]OAF62414.1 hypothetical protein VC83_01271 [Pseudogymnoascus destructans]